MIYECGWYLPDNEIHLQQWMMQVNCQYNGRLSYQRHKYEIALQYCKQQRVAVDVGAHVGLWSWPMSFDFDNVVSFEPMPPHCLCYGMNMAKRTNKILHKVALGSKDGMCYVANRTFGSSGDSGVAETGYGVRMKLLDSYALRSVDLIKVDCEGYEYHVLKGATETLKRCRPCVIVEQKECTGMEKYGVHLGDAIQLLFDLGAKLRGQISGDFVLSWDD